MIPGCTDISRSISIRSAIRFEAFSQGVISFWSPKISHLCTGVGDRGRSKRDYRSTRRPNPMTVARSRSAGRVPPAAAPGPWASWSAENFIKHIFSSSSYLKVIVIYHCLSLMDFLICKIDAPLLSGISILEGPRGNVLEDFQIWLSYNTVLLLRWA